LKIFRNFFSLLLIFTCLCGSVSFAAAVQVKVGATEFPPYIKIDKDGRVTGIIVEVLAYLNSIQGKYKFVAIPASAMRRHTDFKNKVFDVSFFDNVEWGWDKTQVDVSDVFMRGKEVYIALEKPGRNEDYFSDFTNKTMVGMLGYHYGFANFNSDPEFLRKKYRMQLTSSNNGSIEMILDGRGDIAIVSDAFLNWYLLTHPARRRILISKRIDQPYLHTVIVRKGLKPTTHEINGYLKQFRQSKEFERIVNRYGVTP